MINSITDPNTRVSDNVFGVLCSTPISKTDVVSLTTNSVPYSISDLSTPYRLKEMLDPACSPTSADPDELLTLSRADPDELLARSRAFMFAHGMVTLAPDSRAGKGKLVVPNEITRQDYINKLSQHLDLRSFDLGRLFQYPTVEIVRNLLQLSTNPSLDNLSSGPFVRSVVAH